MYRNVEPLIEPLERLQTGKHPFGAAEVELGPYFRDIHDHLRRGWPASRSSATCCRRC